MSHVLAGADEIIEYSPYRMGLLQMLRSGIGTQRPLARPPQPSLVYGRSSDAPGGIWDPAAVTEPGPAPESSQIRLLQRIIGCALRP